MNGISRPAGPEPDGRADINSVVHKRMRRLAVGPISGLRRAAGVSRRACGGNEQLP